MFNSLHEQSLSSGTSFLCLRSEDPRAVSQRLPIVLTTKPTVLLILCSKLGGHLQLVSD